MASPVPGGHPKTPGNVPASRRKGSNQEGTEELQAGRRAGAWRLGGPAALEVDGERGPVQALNPSDPGIDNPGSRLRIRPGWGRGQEVVLVLGNSI